MGEIGENMTQEERWIVRYNEVMKFIVGVLRHRHRRLRRPQIRVDAEAEVVADVVGIEMPVDAGIQDVQAVPSHGEYAVELEVASIRLLVGLQLACGVFAGQIGLVLVECCPGKLGTSQGYSWHEAPLPWPC